MVYYLNQRENALTPIPGVLSVACDPPRVQQSDVCDQFVINSVFVRNPHSCEDMLENRTRLVVTPLNDRHHLSPLPLQASAKRRQTVSDVAIVDDLQNVGQILAQMRAATQL